MIKASSKNKQVNLIEFEHENRIIKGDKKYGQDYILGFSWNISI